MTSRSRNWFDSMPVTKSPKYSTQAISSRTSHHIIPPIRSQHRPLPDIMLTEYAFIHSTYTRYILLL